MASATSTDQHTSNRRMNHASDHADKGTARGTGTAPRDWTDLLLGLKDRIGESHTVLAAAGIAFFGFLAIIPALAALISVTGLVLSPESAADRVEDLLANAPSAAQELLTDQLERLASQSAGALSAGLLLSIAVSLWSASSGMGHLVEGVGVAYGTSDDRNFAVKKLRAIAFTLGAVVFVLFAGVGLAGLPAILASLDLPDWLRTTLNAVFWPLLIAGFSGCLGVLYRRGPDRPRPPWRQVARGATLAAVLFVAGSIGFRLYTASFSSYDKTYGSLAAVVVLLMWLYLTAFVVLLGAHLNAMLESPSGSGSGPGADSGDGVG